MTDETWAAPTVVALNSTIGFASQTETTWGPTALEAAAAVLPAVTPMRLNVASAPAPVDGMPANCATPPTEAAVESVRRMPASIAAFVDATGISRVGNAPHGDRCGRTVSPDDGVYCAMK
jgi:hypothetical protein